MPPTGDRVSKWVETTVNTSPLVMFTSSTCGFCVRTKKLFKEQKIGFAEIVINGRDDIDEIKQSLRKISGITTVPQVFARGQFIGDSSKIQKLHDEGKLKDALNNCKFDYDLIVIGGGSGGIAAAKEAAALGAKVAMFNHVQATPQGVTWGLGGTCVNVGCIPKKLMHNAAILGHVIRDSTQFGWSTGQESMTHDWTTMVENVQQHIKSLNFGYRSTMRKAGVEYKNFKAQLVDQHTVKFTEEDQITADKILLAMGERPVYPDIPGAQKYAITSDDIFSRPAMGKTLVVGASYVALECAGFLASCGFDVTIMVRSILLRGFDQQMADMIGAYMDVDALVPFGHAESKVKFVRECVPSEIIELKPSDLKNKVTGRYRVKAKYNNGTPFEEEFDTVMFAIGREPQYDRENLTKLKINLDKKGRIICNDDDSTSLPNVYAIGDIASGRPQLTPMAIKAGRLLVHRLFAGSSTLAEYDNVPTTVFTPLEYGACGLSEEDAIAKYGKEKLDSRIIGFHVLGPNAGEITQGFAVAMKAGVTKTDFDRTVGIHPTCAEVSTIFHKIND